MTIRRTNPRKQGEIGLVTAIQWFEANGYLVSIPLADNQPYDLVVDDGERLLKVQVKTTTQRSPYGNFSVQLFTGGGNQSFHTRKVFDNTASDLLFVLTDDYEIYVIPSKEVIPRYSLSLCAKYEQYKKAPASQLALFTGGGRRIRTFEG
jgi:hypothetical protein